MRGLRRWLALALSLLLLAAPSVAIAQAAGGDAARAGIAADAAGSALPYFGGGAERFSRVQRAILVMLVTLLTAALLLGVATIAHAFRECAARERRR
jgi:hypothetical protein